jgi:hypothetical protein
MKRKSLLFLFFIIIWLLFVFAIWFEQGYIQDTLIAFSVIICGFSTMVFWVFRNKLKNLIQRWGTTSKLKFLILGGLGAVYVETIFWAIEKLANYEGLAAHPNLLIDLLITMPWYITMTFLLYNIETKQKYSYLEILILGDIYDFFADGIIGTVFQGSFSSITLFLLIIIFPIFLITYSFIVFIPSYALEEELDSIRKEDRFKSSLKYLFGLYPLLGLTVLIIEMFIIMILIENFMLGLIILVAAILITLTWISKKTKFA